MDNQKAEVARHREAALALHRAGKLEEARAEYERILASAPEDPDLLGLLGVVALQERNPGEAESLLRRAVGVSHADAGVHLRNLNNLFVLLVDAGRIDSAAELADANILKWPDDSVPDAVVCRRTVSLAEALARAGRPEAGARLVESVLAHGDADPALRDLAGRLWLYAGDAAAALPHLERAATDRSVGWQPLAALSAALGSLGQETEAKAAARRCAEAAPVYLAPEVAGQKATILVLNQVPEKITDTDGTLGSLHFTKNFIAQASRTQANEFRFASVFADLPGPAPDFPEAAVAFNNLASGEFLSMPGNLERATALVERLGCPVINSPEAVLEMTRQKVAKRLQHIPGLRVPRIERYWRDLSRFEEITADIERQFAYPVIVRHVKADRSSNSLLSEKKTAILVRDRDELRNFLRSVNWRQFYVIEFVDLRKPDGNFRKLRAAFFPDDIVLVTGAHYKEWMVGGWRAVTEGRKFYEAFPHLIDEMNRTLLEPETNLGLDISPVLEAVRNRIPLEVFGMDFDVDDDGEIVVFEVSAAMNFHPRQNPDVRLRFPPQPAERVDRAFRRLVESRMAEHPPAA